MTVLFLHKELLKRYAACVIEKVFPKEMKRYAACVIEKVFPKEICQNIIIMYWNKE